MEDKHIKAREAYRPALFLSSPVLNRTDKHENTERGKTQHEALLLSTNEPSHNKTNKMTVRPAKTKISLGIRPV